MGRARAGNIVIRKGKVYARVTYMGADGKRHARWRAAKNKTEARNLLPYLIELTKNAPDRPGERGYIYALRMEIPGTEHRPIKIGFSLSIEERCNNLAVGSPFPLTVIAFWETSRGMWEEQELHKMLEADRMQGEWFKPTPRLLAVLVERTNKYRSDLLERESYLASLTALSLI